MWSDDLGCAAHRSLGLTDLLSHIYRADLPSSPSGNVQSSTGEMTVLTR